MVLTTQDEVNQALMDPHTYRLMIVVPLGMTIMLGPETKKKAFTDVSGPGQVILDGGGWIQNIRNGGNVTILDGEVFLVNQGGVVDLVNTKSRIHKIMYGGLIRVNKGRIGIVAKGSSVEYASESSAIKEVHGGIIYNKGEIRSLSKSGKVNINRGKIKSIIGKPGRG